ncbi:MAG: carbohydrate ABC transporter substrate-binding protein, partial [Roseibium sp.]
FYFPKVDDPETTKAQLELAKVMMSPETQVAFNLKKGSLPVRGDVDLAAANDCMRKGLDILAKGNIIQSPDQLMSADSLTQVNDLFVEFFNNPDMSAEDAQALFVSIVGNAD